MFQVSVESKEGSPIVVLTDSSTGTEVQVFAFGALLNKFSVIHQGEFINLIDGYASPADANDTITVFFKSARLSPFVCRTKNGRYHFGEHKYQLNRFFLGNHAIHGMLYNALFSVVETSADEVGACVKMQHVYDREDEGFPFAYRCEVEYFLSQDNSLSIKTTITNVDEQLLPIADGWHPYFSFGHSINDCQLEFQSKSILEFDEGLIPTGRRIPYEEFGSIKTIGGNSFDNCFELDFTECQPLCVLRSPQLNLQVEIFPSKDYPYLQVFTPGHRMSIALENLSAAPDALNNGQGLRVLEPHEQAVFSTRYVVSKPTVRPGLPR